MDQNTQTPEARFVADKVDLVTVTESGSAVEMHVVVDIPWSGSDEQLLSLQNKINTYVSFAVDGQLEAHYPKAAGLPWRIVMNCRTGDPDDRSAELLRLTAEPVATYGGQLLVTNQPS